ncbi:unknown [Mycoplasma sp. CAG:956]|nr:unknown [Mycoplasma sp. CAG:956]
MGSAFSSRELEYYKEVPQEKIVEMPTSLVEIMALIQQVPETEEIKEIKDYLITHLDEIRQNTKDIDYSHFNPENLNLSLDNLFNPENLNLSLDNLYNLTAGKISYKEAKELYLNSMYLVKAKLRSF